MTRVQLAVSRLAGVPGMGAAYHTSVLVDGAEFFFSDTGLMRVPPGRTGCSEIFSHAGVGESTQLLDMGTSCRQERNLKKVLGPHFLPGTYDFLRKNCNSFSDCALAYLLGERLEARFREMDLAALDVHSALPSFLRDASLGLYSPNPAADAFDLDATAQALAKRSRPLAPLLTDSKPNQLSKQSACGPSQVDVSVVPSPDAAHPLDVSVVLSPDDAADPQPGEAPPRDVQSCCESAACEPQRDESAHDDDWHVQQAAVHALGAFGPGWPILAARAGKLMAALAQDRRVDLKKAAAEALGVLGAAAVGHELAARSGEMFAALAKDCHADIKPAIASLPVSARAEDVGTVTA